MYLPRPMGFYKKTRKKLINKPFLVRALLIMMGMQILGYGVVFAATKTYESFIGMEGLKIEIMSHIAGSGTGASLVSGDFNGDKVDDLVVSSPLDSTGLKKWNGTVSVIFGEEGASNQTVDLSNDQSIINFFGESSGDQLGSSLTAGDYNDDGISDLVIGAYNAFQNGERPGKVYIIYGQVDLGGQAWDLSTNKPNVLLSGQHDGDNFGLGLSTIDVNNDGVDDLIVGAPMASGERVPRSGAVYIYPGISKGLSQNAATTLFGKKTGERFGSAITGGHFINDYENDILISSYKADAGNLEQSGKIYFYRGNADASQIISPQVTIEGNEKNQWFGFALDAGDLNNDGLADLAVTGFPYGIRENTGQIAIFYGGQRFSGFDGNVENHIFLNNPSFRNVLIGEPSGEAFLGASVVLDDMNGDSLVDVVIGAPGVGTAISKEAGDVYFINNQAGGLNSDYSLAKGDFSTLLHGENADDWFGFTMTTLDFNNDGYKDLAIGARYADDSDSNDDGKVYILLGREGPLGKEKIVFGPDDEPVSRGELVKIIFDEFNLRSKKTDFLNNCYKHKEFCLFNFMATSLYNDLKLEPQTVLYPDIQPGNVYYRDIVDATMLGFINGYMNDKDSPFYPDKPVTRIEALKVILGSLDMVQQKYKFQLASILGSYRDILNQKTYFDDVNPKISYMWWYLRYTNFAVENGIIEDTDNFRPDEYITIGELNDMIVKTMNFLDAQTNEEKKP